MNEFINNLISRMTLEEKIAQLGSIEIKYLVDDDNHFLPDKAETLLKNGIGQVTGVIYTLNITPDEAKKLISDIRNWIMCHTNIKIPPIFHEECLAGLAGKQAPLFPHPIGLGSMWEPDLVKKMAENIRTLMRSAGSHQGLSPVLDLAYDPRWGRNEETYGEDPYLVAENAAAYIKGLQGENHKLGIIATAKHFAGHGHSEGGRNCAPVHMGPREFRDSVLFPYEAAVRVACVKSIMNAYHDIDGIPCAANRELLTDILRGELGFDGVVVSDYGSIERLVSHHFTACDKKEAAKQALEAGVDVELPSTDFYGQPLLEAVRTGLVSEETVDTAVERHLLVKWEFGVFDEPDASADIAEVFMDSSGVQLAHELARKSITLLKNENKILPINNKKLKKIAVIGPSAANGRNLLGSYSYQSLNEHSERFISGIDCNPSDFNFTDRNIISPLDAIIERAGTDISVEYAMGCDFFTDDSRELEAAVTAAKEADVAILAIGDRSGLTAEATTGEAIDRISSKLFGAQEKLVNAVADTSTPVILVLINGRPIDATNLIEKCSAVIEAWLPGEHGGNAIADVLFGMYNPGGKLPVAIMKHQGQHPLPYYAKRVNYYKEYIDCDMQPLFPLGHGLSFTEFEYSKLSVTPESIGEAGEICASFFLKNIGEVFGEEVVQLYISDEIASLARPALELKGFKRIGLNPGQEVEVEFIIHTDQLAFHDRMMRIVVESGKFKVMIGASSKDIRLEEHFEVYGCGYEVRRECRIFFSAAHCQVK